MSQKVEQSNCLSIKWWTGEQNMVYPLRNWPSIKRNERVDIGCHDFEPWKHYAEVGKRSQWVKAFAMHTIHLSYIPSSHNGGRELALKAVLWAHMCTMTGTNPYFHTHALIMNKIKNLEKTSKEVRHRKMPLYVWLHSHKKTKISKSRQTEINKWLPESGERKTKAETLFHTGCLLGRKKCLKIMWPSL